MWLWSARHLFCSFVFFFLRTADRVQRRRRKTGMVSRDMWHGRAVRFVGLGRRDPVTGASPVTLGQVHRPRPATVPYTKSERTSTHRRIDDPESGFEEQGPRRQRSFHIGNPFSSTQLEPLDHEHITPQICSAVPSDPACLATPPHPASSSDRSPPSQVVPCPPIPAPPSPPPTVSTMRPQRGPS